MFKSEHYRQAALAVCAGIAIRLVLAAPVIAVKAVLWILSFVINFDAVTWDDKIINGLDFISNSVLQLPFFLMSLMRYITPTLDNMFMDALAWVDTTYVAKHEGDQDQSSLRAMYYPNLKQYERGGPTAKHRSTPDAVLAFLMRYGRRAAISLAVYAASYVPYVGRLVLPAASFWTFNKAVGPVPAVVIFGGGVLLPRRWLVMFLQTYFASRGLMRELVSIEQVSVFSSSSYLEPDDHILLSLSVSSPRRGQLCTRTTHITGPGQLQSGFLMVVDDFLISVRADVYIVTY
jgi:hypothetical protein